MKSRRTYFLSALFAIGLFIQSSWSFAQFNYGLRAGGQLVNLQTNESSFEWRPSYHGGLFFTYGITNRFSLVGDLLYSDKGFKEKGDSRDYIRHLTYLSMPLMVQYHLNDKLSFLAGGEFSLLLSSHMFAGGTKSDESAFDKRTDFGIAGGVSYQLNSRVNVMIRYVQGVSSIDKFKNSWARHSAFNQAIQLSLGYAYVREEDHEHLHDRRSMFSIGIRQGISKYVTISSHDNISREESSSGRNGYQAEVDFRITKRRFYTSLGLVYSQKGGHVEGEKDVKQNFLGVPVIVGYAPFKTRKLTFSIEAGLTLNRLMSSSPLPNEDHPFNKIKNHDILSGIYGFELSTDALACVTPFVSFRKEVDFASYYQWSLDAYTDARYLYHKGQALSVGIRMKGVSATRDRSKEETDKFNYRAHMDSIVRPFSFGLKAGLNMNDTKHREPVLGNDDHSRPMLAAHGGMYFQIRLYKRLSLVPEVLYIRKGFKFDYKGSEMKAVANYIEFPVVLSYQLTRKIGIDAGGAMGILLNSKFDPGFSNSYHDDYDWYYGGDGIGIENGIIAGMRYNLNSRITIATRYFRGASDISTQNYSDVDEFNTNIQLSTTFRVK